MLVDTVGGSYRCTPYAPELTAFCANFLPLNEIPSSHSALPKQIHVCSFIRNQLSGFCLDISLYFVKSSLQCFLTLKTPNDDNIDNGDARTRMLRFCEACSGRSFYFVASLIKNLQVKTVFVSYYLILSLPIFLKCFLIFA